MKNLFLSFAVITSVLAVSCKKDDNTKPSSSSSTPVTISVEYIIKSESANVEAIYLFPDASGNLVTTSETITRGDHSIKFTTKKGKFFSVEAYNVIAARKYVNVQIIIDGVLFKEASSNSPSDKAVASGNY